MSAPQPGDKSAAFSGLILGSIALFVLVFAIVRITNASFAGKHGRRRRSRRTSRKNCNSRRWYHVPGTLIAYGPPE